MPPLPRRLARVRPAAAHLPDVFVRVWLHTHYALPGVCRFAGGVVHAHGAVPVGPTRSEPIGRGCERPVRSRLRERYNAVPAAAAMQHRSHDGRACDTGTLKHACSDTRDSTTLGATLAAAVAHAVIRPVVPAVSRPVVPAVGIADSVADGAAGRLRLRDFEVECVLDQLRGFRRAGNAAAVQRATCTVPRATCHVPVPFGAPRGHVTDEVQTSVPCRAVPCTAPLRGRPWWCSAGYEPCRRRRTIHSAVWRALRRRASRLASSRATPRSASPRPCRCASASADGVRFCGFFSARSGAVAAGVPLHPESLRRQPPGLQSSSLSAVLLLHQRVGTRSLSLALRHSSFRVHW